MLGREFAASVREEEEFRISVHTQYLNLPVCVFGYVRNEFVKPLQRTHAQRHTHTDNSCQQKLRGA